jgi:hypothetical protein
LFCEGGSVERTISGFKKPYPLQQKQIYGGRKPISVFRHFHPLSNSPVQSEKMNKCERGFELEKAGFGRSVFCENPFGKSR